MTLLLSAFLFSLSSNLDNLVVGIAYGLKKIKIGIIANLIIAIITSTCTFLSMSLGVYILYFLPNFIANSFGAITIIILGVYFLVQSIIKLTNNKNSKELALKDIDDMIKYAQKSDLDNSGDINIKEAVLIAFALTFNNLGTGIAASITGVNIQYTVILTFIFSILLITIGETIGNNVFGNFLGKYAPLISGILLIILGIIEFFN
jgi:putative sporulation protein YtaF